MTEPLKVTGGVAVLWVLMRGVAVSGIGQGHITTSSVSAEVNFVCSAM